MRIREYIRNSIFYLFLSEIFIKSRCTFYVVVVVIALQIGVNFAKSNLYPFFIYSMYSEPQNALPDTTSRFVFYTDGKAVPVQNTFVENRISEPIARFLNLTTHGGEDPVTNKRINYLNYIMPAAVVQSLKTELYARSVHLEKFIPWYKEYFSSYMNIKYSILDIYNYEYSTNNLNTPIKITHVLSIRK